MRQVKEKKNINSDSKEAFEIDPKENCYTCHEKFKWREKGSQKEDATYVKLKLKFDSL